MGVCILYNNACREIIYGCIHYKCFGSALRVCAKYLNDGDHLRHKALLAEWWTNTALDLRTEGNITSIIECIGKVTSSNVLLASSPCLPITNITTFIQCGNIILFI